MQEAKENISCQHRVQVHNMAFLRASKKKISLDHLRGRNGSVPVGHTWRTLSDKEPQGVTPHRLTGFEVHSLTASWKVS